MFPVRKITLFMEYSSEISHSCKYYQLYGIFATSNSFCKCQCQKSQITDPTLEMSA